MKKTKILAVIVLFAVAISILPGQVFALEEPEVTAEAAIIMDANTGEVFYEKNADNELAPASMTKIMTALIVIEAVENGECTMDDTVVAPDDCLDQLDEDATNANPAIQPGETMSIRDLLYCALLNSANEACVCLAQYVCDSEAEFVDRMNEKADELGCTGTWFSDTNGLSSYNHYSTARDMATIARECLNHTKFKEICGTLNYTVPATDYSDERLLVNTNEMLDSGSEYYNEYIHGIKTGYTPEAGKCLVSYAVNEDVELICVVMGCPNSEETEYRYEDTTTLVNWVFENFTYQQVLSSSETVIKVPVEMSGDNVVEGKPAESLSLLLPNDFNPDDLEYEYVIYSERDNSPLVAPLTAGTVLGEITVVAEGEEVTRIDIIASNSVEMEKGVYLKSSIYSILQKPIIHKLLVLLIVMMAIYLVLVFVYVVLRSRHRRSVSRARKERARMELEENYSRNTKQRTGK